MLGLSRSASARDIKRAHRKLAAKYHPDKNADGDTAEVERIFHQIGEAIEVLGDEKKRQQYDSGMDYEDIVQAEQQANAQKHQQHRNPFQNFHFRH